MSEYISSKSPRTDSIFCLDKIFIKNSLAILGELYFDFLFTISYSYLIMSTGLVEAALIVLGRTILNPTKSIPNNAEMNKLRLIGL